MTKHVIEHGDPQRENWEGQKHALTPKKNTQGDKSDKFLYQPLPFDPMQK